jgi:voltage-gated potassium channel
VFRLPMPARLAGRTLREVDLPARTGCTVVGVLRNGACTSDVDPDQPLPADAQLVLIGDDQAEQCFYDRYVTSPAAGGLRGLVERLRPDA